MWNAYGTDGVQRITPVVMYHNRIMPACVRQISMPQLRLAHDYIEEQCRRLVELGAARGGDVEVQVGAGWEGKVGSSGQRWRGGEGGQPR